MTTSGNEAWVAEGNLEFLFPAEWTFARPEEWSYYKNVNDRLTVKLLCKCDGTMVCDECGKFKVAGARIVDFVAVDEQKCLWLIEIKDYRVYSRKKTIEVVEEVALKARDSLAVLVGARLHANDSSQKQVAIKAMACDDIRVVLHLESKKSQSDLAPKPDANIYQKLKSLIKDFDPRPLVVNKDYMGSVQWQCRSKAGSKPH